MSRNGTVVSAFERELAAYCGAKWAIAAANGTVTLQAALVALGVKPHDRVAVPPLTHAATSIAVLNVGALPVFLDVDPDLWIKPATRDSDRAAASIPVSLYGLCLPLAGDRVIDDAAQTLRKHSGCAFTSLSFQSSKILSTGEGGALLTDDDELAERARSYLSLGYKMAAGQARIDSAALKSPTFDRHHQYPAVNGRMNDVTAAEGLRKLDWMPETLDNRRYAAWLYRDALAGSEGLTPQFVPEGWRHDYWTFTIAVGGYNMAPLLADAMVRHGAERPFPAWKLTYQEPAFRHLAPDGTCPVAESLQPNLLQMQTNDIASAERNAHALKLAIRELHFDAEDARSDATGIPCAGPLMGSPGIPWV
jgi:perosamine synthetase